MLLPVPRIVIYPGDPIPADSVTERAFNVRDPRRLIVHSSRDNVIGKVAKRTLLKGEPISLSALKDADVVKQGRPSTIVLETGSLSIRASGTVLQSGTVGDWVSVQNIDSGTVIKGLVQADGTIKVAEP